ncbi:MAG: uracil-DNA glycosylase [Pyrinomonadaceae bacterium]
MTTSSTKDLLSELLAQTREYARYSAELGIDTVAMTRAAVLTPQTTTPEAVKQPPVKATTIKERLSPPIVSAQTLSPGHATPPGDSLFGDFTPAPVSLPTAAETLEDIWRDIGDCTRCALCSGRTQVVNTHGNSRARLMFVGEAPGADEDAQGKPFVGRAGQLLTKMIEAMGMKREDVIIGNVNRCRPPANRQPTLEEAAICRPFLFREIAVIQPQVIVVMGNTALRNLLEVREGITRVRGNFQDFRGIKVMPTFHPAYLLRDPSKKRETWEDLKKVMDYLDSHPRKSADAAGD